MANSYQCSNGERVTQSQINSRLSQMKKGILHRFICHCGTYGTSWSHSVPQKECKYMGKTELIWDEDNGEWECNECHKEYESFKSMNYTNHKNWIKRMAYCAEHAPEYYRRRLAFIDDPKIMQKLINLIPDNTEF